MSLLRQSYRNFNQIFFVLTWVGWKTQTESENFTRPRKLAIRREVAYLTFAVLLESQMVGVP